ncbi:MAG: PilZ domain-containing protein [Myxococcota bacterium]
MAAERILTSIPVDFEGLEVSGSGVIQNLGLGGLFVGSRTIPAEGEPVSLHFELPGEIEISLTAMVWWTTDSGPKERSANPGFGLRLVDAHDDYEEAVAKLLS